MHFLCCICSDYVVGWDSSLEKKNKIYPWWNIWTNTNIHIKFEWQFSMDIISLYSEPKNAVTWKIYLNFPVIFIQVFLKTVQIFLWWNWKTMKWCQFRIKAKHSHQTSLAQRRGQKKPIFVRDPSSQYWSQMLGGAFVCYEDAAQT